MPDHLSRADREADRARLRRVLKEGGLTHEDLARAVGVNLSTISLWVRERRTPTGLYALKLHRVLDRLERAMADERQRVQGALVEVALDDDIDYAEEGE